MIFCDEGIHFVMSMFSLENTVYIAITGILIGFLQQFIQACFSTGNSAFAKALNYIFSLIWCPHAKEYHLVRKLEQKTNAVSPDSCSIDVFKPLYHKFSEHIMSKPVSSRSKKIYQMLSSGWTLNGHWIEVESGIWMKTGSAIEKQKHGDWCVDELQIYTTHSHVKLELFISECKRKYQDWCDKDQNLYYFANGLNSEHQQRWLRSTLCFDPQLWKSLYGSEYAEISNIVSCLDERQKVALLLHGPPGCGKTSAIRALSQQTNRHIFNLNLSLFGSNSELMDLVFGDPWLFTSNTSYKKPKKVIFVFEEIDVQLRELDSQKVIRKKQKKKKEKTVTGTKFRKERGVTFYGLLNLLDGIIQLRDVIIVMTTNYVDRVDPRLFRPGRITHRIFLGYTKHCDAVAMVQSKFPDVQPGQVPEDVHERFCPAALMQWLQDAATFDDFRCTVTKELECVRQKEQVERDACK